MKDVDRNKKNAICTKNNRRLGEEDKRRYIQNQPADAMDSLDGNGFPADRPDRVEQAGPPGEQAPQHSQQQSGRREGN